MSVVIMTQVWQRSKAGGNARLVLLALADQANDEGECWPSVANIAKRCLITERSVQRNLLTLEEELGELERQERPGRSTVYKITIPRGDELSPPSNRRPVNLSPGGDAGVGGGVTLASPRTVIEPSGNERTSTIVDRDNDSTDVDHTTGPGRDAAPSPEVVELCSRLARRIRANGNQCREPDRRWFRAGRLLLEADGCTVDQVRKIIDWSQAHPFWSTNVLSMQKLREKYSTLQAQAKNPTGKAPAVTGYTHTSDKACPVPGHEGYPAHACGGCRMDKLTAGSLAIAAGDVRSGLVAS